MNLYEKMYARMFNAAKEALLQMEQQNYGVAKATLMRAQFECESLYIEDDTPQNACSQDGFTKNDQKQGSAG